MKRSLIRFGVASACIAAVCAAVAVPAATAAVPTWGTTSTISSTTTDSNNPQVSLSADGTKASAIWERLGTTWVIDTKSASVNYNTATFGSPATLSTTTNNASTPQIVVSADGTKALAVWTYNDGTHTVIQAATATLSGNTATWSAVATISDNTQDAAVPEAALSSDGTEAVVVWRRNNGTVNTIQAKTGSITSNLATWSAASNLSDGTNAADSPHVALSSDGSKALAVWKGSDGAHTIIQASAAAIASNTATWSASANLSDTTQDASEAQLSMAPDGLTAVAVWKRSNGTHTVIQSAAATIASGVAAWGTATDLSDGTQDATRPQIARAATANQAIAVWVRNDGTHTVIQSSAATFAGNVATWGTVSVLSNNAQNADSPQIAVSADGTKSIAVWKRSNGARDVIQSATATVSGVAATWTVVTDLSDSNQHAELPQVAFSSSGDRAIAVWRRYSGEHWVVQARVYGITNQLPPNGANTDLLAGIGTVLLAGGLLLVLARRRTRRLA